jgi:hypothetical protein
MAKRKKTTTSPPLSSRKQRATNKKVPDSVTSDEAFNLKNMVKEQLASYIRKNKIKDETATLLTSMLQEYLSCCLVLGYDFNGQPVTIISVNNQQDADAIGTQLQRFLMNSQGLGPSSPMGPPDGPMI